LGTGTVKCNLTLATDRRTKNGDQQIVSIDLGQTAQIAAGRSQRKLSEWRNRLYRSAGKTTNAGSNQPESQ